MIKLQHILEEMSLDMYPPDHQPALRVPIGGSSCANCKWLSYDDSRDTTICTNTYYKQWSKTNTLPYPSNEYCSDWWQPIDDLTEYIRKQGSSWSVFSKAGKKLGTHTTKEKALAQLRAIEISKHK